MNSEQWQKIKEIFDAATQMPVSERRDFVKQFDESLQREVFDLLESHDEAEDFIENSAFSVKKMVAEDAPPSLVGEKIGAYRIEREIGRGGMGAVYLASRADAEFEKKVAVKLIKRGLDTDEIIRRFRNERQILAGLEHPNITRLIDGGATVDGLPYLVMDYVEGEPLTEYCRRRSLSIDESLNLFLKICSAVKYAHQNLIIHRDLKPSNVLVKTDGTPKLLDFGIAKLIAENADDETKQNTMTRVMTPEYASPEQIGGGAITTLTDVYSLGVMLYELLTGEQPFKVKSKNPDEISKIITDSQPLKPSSVLRAKFESENPQSQITNLKSLRGDLDNIILMAMRKEPERRYSSVEQFAEDIRRYQNNLPVLAQQDTFGYRASKFVGRNKFGVAAAAGIAFSLIGGIFGTTRQAKIAHRQRDKALAEAEKAEKINRFLQKMLASPDPRVVGKDVKVLEVLKIAAAEIDTNFADQPEIAADLETTIGLTYLSLGQIENAEPYLQKALQTRQKIYGNHHLETAMSFKNMGMLKQEIGDFQAAEPFYKKALEIIKNFDDKNGKLARASVLQSYGYLLGLKGESEKAVGLHYEELEIRRRFFGENHPDVATTLGKLGGALILAGDKPKAETILRQSLELSRKNYGDNHPDTALALINLIGAVYEAKPHEAEGLALEALQIRRKIFGENHPETAWSYYNLAYLVGLRGDNRKAINFANKVLKMRDGGGLPNEHPSVGGSLLVLGKSLLAQGKPDEAKTYLEECLALREKTLPADHYLFDTTSIFLGECLLLLNETEKGKRLLFESYKNLKEKLGENHEQTQIASSKIKEFYPSAIV